jgi:Cu+-exporting ATPase
MPSEETQMNDMLMRSAGAIPVGIGHRVESVAEIELRVGGMDCPHCPANIEEALGKLDGVSVAHVNLANQSTHVAYDSSRLKVLDLVRAIRAAGYSAGTATMRVHIKNMHCSSCVIRIASSLRCRPRPV